MKKVSYLTILIAFSIISLFCYIKINPSTQYVQAQSTTITNDIEGIVDENLYNALLWKNYNQFLPVEQREIYITADMFSTLETLDLSSSGITSLLGLNLLDLSSLKEVNLSDNAISIITPEVAQALSGIETLNLSGNSFKSIDLSLFTNLSNLNLSYNQLTNIDISMLVAKNNAINVNLMANLFSNHEHILLDSQKTYNINLIYNKLYSTSAQFFTNNNVDVYIQNTLNPIPTTSDKITILGGYSMPQFNIKVVDSQQQTVATYHPNSQNMLGVGDYTLKFYNNETPLYNIENLETYAFKDITYQVIPSQPQFEVYIDNKLVEDIADMVFSKPVTIKFNAEQNAIIKISVDNQSYIQTSEIELTQQGTHRITVICVLDGKQSITKNVYVRIQNESNVPLVLVVILVACALFAILFALRIYAQKEVNFNKKNNKND